MNIKLLSRFGRLCAAGLLLATGTANAQYCIPVLGATCAITSEATWFTNFKTTGGIVNINNTSACSDPSSYKYYQGVYLEAKAGDKIGYSAIQAKPFPSGFGLWINWSKDTIYGNGPIPEKLSKPTQFFNAVPNLTSSTPTTTPLEFVIDPRIKEGWYRMRIRVTSTDNGDPGIAYTNLPCRDWDPGLAGALYYTGEIEEYDVHILNPCLPPKAKGGAYDVLDHSAKYRWGSRFNAEMYEWILDTTRDNPSAAGYFMTTDSNVTFPNAYYSRLECGTKYYMHVRTICDTTPKPQMAWVTSDWYLDSFTTDECCYIPQVTMSRIEATTAIATWPAVVTANWYEYGRSTLPGNPPLNQGTKISLTQVQLQGLPCNSMNTFYLRAACSPTPFSPYGETIFYTKPCLGVENVNESTGSLEVYPNPATNKLNIAVNGWRGGTGSITVMDISGRTVRTATVTNGTIVIDIADLSTGAYFVKYADEYRSEVIKVNKQ